MEKTVYYIDSQQPDAAALLAEALQRCLLGISRPWEELILLCIGSDRITGDSLGPLCGQQLSGHLGPKGFVYGTLAHPVHALNLVETLEIILARHPFGLIIAIDASLGSEEHLGYISVGEGPLYPGAGVRKQLPAVGDVFITGIVNQAGLLDRFLLQTTRLAVVMQLSQAIIQGILYTFSPINRGLYVQRPLSHKRRKKSSKYPDLQDLTAFYTL